MGGREVLMFREVYVKPIGGGEGGSGGREGVGGKWGEGGGELWERGKWREGRGEVAGGEGEGGGGGGGLEGKDIVVF